MNRIATSLGVAAATIAAAGASAQTIELPAGFNFVVEAPGSGQMWMLSNNPDSVASVEDMGNGSIQIIGEATGVMGTDWNYEFTIPAPDLGIARSVPTAAINAAFTVTNMNAAPMDFTVTTVAAASIPGPTEVLGSHSGNVGDNPNIGDGATLSTIAGLPLYQGQIDGAGTLDLFANPFSISAPAFLTNSYGPQSSGFTGGFPALTSTIGIVNNFNVTGLDNAGMTSTFVVRVPAPASAALLALGGLAAARNSDHHQRPAPAGWSLSFHVHPPPIPAAR